jgi:tetratricopeptide (TPR) repeat protein
MSALRAFWTGGVVALFVLASAAGAQPPAGEAVTAPQALSNPALVEAFATFKQGDVEAALKAARAAVAASAELPPAPVVLAQWFAQTDRPGPMRGALERAISEDPSDPEAYVLLSDLALGEGRITEAELLCYRAYNLLQAFQRSQRRKDLLVPRVLKNLALAAEARGDWRGAQKYLNAWLAVEPENAVAMQRAGQVLFREGQTAEALDCLRVAVRIDPRLLAPEVIVARLYEQAGNRPKAAESMAAAIAARPNDVPVRLAAAQWALETGQLAEAREHVQAAARLSPNAPEARHLEGLLDLAGRDYAAAEQIFEAAVKQSPSNFSARNNLAVALVEQQDPAKRRRALEQAQANLRQHPNQPDALSTLGWVLYRLGQTDEAERALQMASSSGNMAPDTAYFLARIAQDQGRPADARQLAQTALTGKGLFLLRQEAEELLGKLK